MATESRLVSCSHRSAAQAGAWHLLNWGLKVQNADMAHTHIHNTHTRLYKYPTHMWPCRELARSCSGNVKNELTKHEVVRAHIHIHSHCHCTHRHKFANAYMKHAHICGFKLSLNLVLGLTGNDLKKVRTF